eukprot:5293969-Prymnesium_polylepis.1
MPRTLSSSPHSLSSASIASPTPSTPTTSCPRRARYARSTLLPHSGKSTHRAPSSSSDPSSSASYFLRTGCGLVRCQRVEPADHFPCQLCSRSAAAGCAVGDAGGCAAAGSAVGGVGGCAAAGASFRISTRTSPLQTDSPAAAAPPPPSTAAMRRAAPIASVCTEGRQRARGRAASRAPPARRPAGGRSDLLASRHVSEFLLVGKPKQSNKENSNSTRPLHKSQCRN